MKASQLTKGAKYYDSIFKALQYIGKENANTFVHRFKKVDGGQEVFMSNFEVKSLLTLTELN